MIEYNNNSNYVFYDLVEKYFLWETKYILNQKWIGIIHCTQSTPHYLNKININNLFNNQNFINGLDKCLFIICLSEYVAEFLRNKFRSIGKNILIHVQKS